MIFEEYLGIDRTVHTDNRKRCYFLPKKVYKSSNNVVDEQNLLKDLMTLI